MADFKKPVFSPYAAEEYFSMLLTSYRDTANDIFRRDNEGRHASGQHYSAEYQKYLGMQIAMREVLEYFGKFDLGDCCAAFETQRESRVVTNADRIRSMSDEELAEFLENIAYESEPVWTEPFDKAFCQTCSEETCFARACPNGKGSLWWLKQPQEDENYGIE